MVEHSQEDESETTGHEAHHETTSRGEYDPSNVELPSKAPPLRQTAPQTPYTGRQVGIGFAILLVGVVLTFVLPIVAA